MTQSLSALGGFGARHSSWNFYAGFREIHDTGLGGGESAEHVTPTVLDWIARNAKNDNWYLHVNYWDAHGPYRARASTACDTASSPAGNKPSDYEFKPCRFS